MLNSYCEALAAVRLPTPERERQVYMMSTEAQMPVLDKGCIVYEGTFDGAPKDDGDLEHIRDQLGPGRVLPASVAYRLSPDCVHESVVMDRPTPRTFLRIALET